MEDTLHMMAHKFTIIGSKQSMNPISLTSVAMEIPMLNNTDMDSNIEITYK